jgi:hypothetical protein
MNDDRRNTGRKEKQKGRVREELKEMKRGGKKEKKRNNEGKKVKEESEKGRRKIGMNKGRKEGGHRT